MRRTGNGVGLSQYTGATRIQEFVEGSGNSVPVFGVQELVER